MSQMLGADPDALDHVAASFAVAAHRLDTLRNSLGAAVQHNPWRGPAAEQFRGRWDGTYQRILLQAADALRVARQQLAANAQQQRQASAAAGGGSLSRQSTAYWYRIDGDVLSRHHAIPVPVLRAYPAMPWVVAQGDAQAQLELGKSPEEQARWWNSLSSEQRDALLFAAPSLIMGMRGLPVDVLHRAQSQYAVQQQGETAVKTHIDTYSAKLDGKAASAGMTGTITTTEYKDGHYTVALAVDADLAKKLGTKHDGGSIGISGNGTITYTFDNKDAADLFVKQFKSSFDPLHSGLTPDKVLHNWQWANSDATVSGKLTGELKASVGGEDVKISGDVGATYDLHNGNRTVFVDVGGTIDANGQEIAGTKSTVQVTLDSHNHVIEAHVAGSADVSNGVQAQEVLKQVSGGKFEATQGVSDGGRISYSADLDVTDPATAKALHTLLANPTSSQALQGVLTQSDVSVSVDHTATTSSDADFGLVDVKSSHEDDANVVTFEKPAGTETFVQTN